MTTTRDLVERALEIAATKIGIREVTPNRGPEIDKWIQGIGLDPAGKYPYCVAFLVAVFDAAAAELGMKNPLPRTGKAVRLWSRARDLYKSHHATPGAIFVHLKEPQNPDSAGHAGIITGVGDDRIWTIEANTNGEGSREGDGVYEKWRPLSYVNCGYIDVSRDLSAQYVA